MGQWVNYAQVRERVSFAQVLEDYGVQVTVKGDQAMGFCPLPGHQARSKRSSKSFSVNLTKGIFQCFGCQAKGNVIDFTALMENLDPTDSDEFRQAALCLQTRYLVGDGATRPTSARVSGQGKKPMAAVAEVEAEAETPAAPEDTRPRVVNAPLPFELKGLDPSHAYLSDRRLTAETIRHFAIGFSDRGLMKGRVAIPLHDADGVLVGYAGRLVDDDAISDEQPKYRLPGDREKEGTVYEFRKSEFLFNGHRLLETVDDLVVVEGFFGAMWLHQCGFPNVVALMGASMSKRQASIILDILSVDGMLWVMSDGDDAGVRCAHAVFDAIGPERAVRWARLDAGKQPEDLEPDELRALLDPFAQ